MGFFDFLRGANTDAGVKRYNETDGAVLLDVRTPDEFRSGHIPKAVNLPLDSIGRHTENMLKEDTPLFVYCLSGARSARAAALLRSIGYTDVSDIGGINSYHGEIVR